MAIGSFPPGTASRQSAPLLPEGFRWYAAATGWTARLDEFRQLCDDGKGTLLWASNFSVGVNLFRAISRSLARMMDAFRSTVRGWRRSIMSTSSIIRRVPRSRLPRNIVAECSRLSAWAEPEEGVSFLKDILGVDHIRRGEVPGIHTILWESPVDENLHNPFRPQPRGIRPRRGDGGRITRREERLP